MANLKTEKYNGYFLPVIKWADGSVSVDIQTDEMAGVLTTLSGKTKSEVIFKAKMWIDTNSRKLSNKNEGKSIIEIEDYYGNTLCKFKLNFYLDTTQITSYEDCDLADVEQYNNNTSGIRIQLNNK